LLPESVDYHNEALIRVQGLFERSVMIPLELSSRGRFLPPSRWDNGMTEILIAQTGPELIPQLVELQMVCYPTLADTSRFKAPHFESHL